MNEIEGSELPELPEEPEEPELSDEPELPELPEEPELLLAFAPVHKRAFGTAVGLALGLAMGLVTLASLVFDPAGEFRLELLSEYFAGYRVSPLGALIGAAWGLFVGLVAGWFLAFARNLVVAIWIFVVRARAEMRATRDFLDHI